MKPKRSHHIQVLIKGDKVALVFPGHRSPGAWDEVDEVIRVPNSTAEAGDFHQEIRMLTEAEMEAGSPVFASLIAHVITTVLGKKRLL